MINYTAKFKKIKKYLNNKNDELIEIGGFYFNRKAAEKVKSINYFLNSYYDLTVYDFLNMIKYNDNIKQVKKCLLNDYKRYYALAIYDNFKAILKEV